MKDTNDGSDELQQRTCRACNATYKYPVPKSMATRFYCDSCAGLPSEVRATFEQYNKRLKALAAKVRQLGDKLKHHSPG